MLQGRYAEEIAESHVPLPRSVQDLEHACGGAEELTQCTISLALLSTAFSVAQQEAMPYHINIIHMQKERDLMLQKNKCNNFQFDPAIFHMNTHIIFLLFNQFFICSRTTLLSFGDVS